MNTRRAGFAIPMALMVIGFLSISLMAAFALTDNDFRITTNRSKQVDAYALAQTGLERFLVDRTTLGFTSNPPAASESTRIALTGGFADVILTQVRDSTGGLVPIYVVRSRGTTTPPSLAGYRPASYTVAQYTQWYTGTLNVLAGWTSLNGFSKSGNSGSLAGADRCGRMPTVAGVAVSTTPGYSGHTGPASGSPPINSSMTQAQLAAAVGIDWVGIVNQTAITPDIVIPGGTFPNTTAFAANLNWFPVIFVNGNLSLPNDGRGTLIVTGSLIMGGGAQWDGIVLVGDQLRDNGSGQIFGATVSGLNVLRGMSVTTPSADANGTKTYQFDSCLVAKAAARFASLRAMKNTWIDNWAW